MPGARGAMTCFPSARYSKIRVGVFSSVKTFRRFGMTPTSHRWIASTISSVAFGPKYSTTSFDSLIAHKAHHTIEKLVSRTIDPQYDVGNRSVDHCECLHCRVESVSFNQRSVMHDHESLVFL